jgi:hypothetical protein
MQFYYDLWGLYNLIFLTILLLLGCATGDHVQLAHGHCSPSSVWGCLLLVRFHSTIRVGSTFGVAAGLPGVKADLNDSILETALCFIINPITRILMGLVKFEPR